MADLLRFKKGLSAGLENLAKSAGTIYVTTDEHAMYVDISDTERIRLGDFIVVPSLNDLATSAYKPWSTTALYYVTAENALARYNGTEWKQINDTSEIEADILQLKTAVGTKKTENAEATGIYLDIDNLNKKIEDLVGGEGDDVTSIVGLSARLATAEDEIDALQGTVGDASSGLVKRVTDLEGEVDDIDTRVTNNATAITKLNGNSETEGSVDYKVHQATKDLATQQSVADIKTVVDKLDGSVETEGSVKKQIADATKDLATKQSLKDTSDVVAQHTTILNTLNGDAATTGSVAEAKTIASRAEGKADANAGEIATLKGNQDTVGSVDYKVHQATKDLATKQSVTDLNTTVTNQGTAITGLQNAMTGNAATEGTVANKIKAALDAEKAETGSIGSLDKRVTAAEGDIDTLQEKVGNVDISGAGASITDAISKINTKAGENAGNITSLQTEVDKLKTADTTLDTNLKKYADEKAAAAATSANGYTDTELGKLNTTLTGKIDKNAEDIKTANTNHTQLSTKVDGIDERLGTAEDAIKLLNGNETTVGSVEYKIAQKLQAADAMTFKGVITEELPTTGVKIGDTYKVGEAGSFGGHDCKVGDLLIANVAAGKTEVNGTIPNDDLVWEYVPSGGEDDTDPTLSVANNVVSLKNAANAPLGSVTFAGSATEAAGGVSVTTSNSTISIDMVWGSF